MAFQEPVFSKGPTLAMQMGDFVELFLSLYPENLFPFLYLAILVPIIQAQRLGIRYDGDAQYVSTTLSLKVRPM